MMTGTVNLGRGLGRGLGGEGRDGSGAGMTFTAKPPYTGYRFPGEVISHAVWLYFRFPLSLRMVEEMLAARGIDVSRETVRQWARKFGQSFANQIRRKLPDPALLQSWGRAEKAPWPGPDQAAIPNRVA